MADETRREKAEIIETETRQEGAAPVSEDAKKTAPKLEVVKRVGDASDIEELWLDPKLGDGITTAYRHEVPVGKPKDFFRTHPLEDYRRRFEIYTHKVEGVIEETHYIIAPAMRGQIEEARPCVLVCVVDREGEPRLWPIKFPKEGEKDNEAWRTARVAARNAIDRWVKLIWKKRTYLTREAQEGYAPDPDFSKLPPYMDLVDQAFGPSGVIRDAEHPMYRDLMGIRPKKAEKDADDDI
jgi:hypothetical protein